MGGSTPGAVGPGVPVSGYLGSSAGRPAKHPLQPGLRPITNNYFGIFFQFLAGFVKNGDTRPPHIRCCEFEEIRDLGAGQEGRSPDLEFKSVFYKTTPKNFRSGRGG